MTGTPRKRKKKSVLTAAQKEWIRLLAAFLLGAAACFTLLKWDGIKRTVHRLLTPYKLPAAEVIGIDISHHQGKINWDDLKFADGGRAVDFVVAKATEGTDHKDKDYASSKAACEKKGIPFGAYHYFKPNVPSGLQASHFVKTAKLGSGDLIPVLDIEEKGLLSAAELRAGVCEWLRAIEGTYGVKPVIYCNLDYYYRYFSTAEFKDYKFWIAAYTRDFLAIPYVLWQQTDKGILDGIKEKVDVDIFNGTPAEFRRTMVMN